MNRTRLVRILGLIALVAAVAALLLMLLPSAHGNTQPDWLAMLPVFFVGLLAPLSISENLHALAATPRPRQVVRAAQFQRPPPSQIF
jgi:prepilin signal peptidase PulO-like enzyme (type II secretory pathway)